MINGAIKATKHILNQEELQLSSWVWKGSNLPWQRQSICIKLVMFQNLSYAQISAKLTIHLHTTSKQDVETFLV